MIQFKREDNMSIKLIFDYEGLEKILESFKKVYKGDISTIYAKLDGSVISLKKSVVTDTSIQMEYVENGETQLKKEDNQVIWLLEKEDIEIAVERLEQCKIKGYFSPGEFIRVQVPKNKKLDYIYCELKTQL